MSDTTFEGWDQVTTAQAFHPRTQEFLPGGQHFKKVILASALAVHLGALGLAAAFIHPREVPLVMEDRIIEMVNLEELQLPPPEDTPPVSQAPVIPEIALPVKDTPPPVQNPSTQAPAGPGRPVEYISQGKLDQVPAIDGALVLSRIQYPALAAQMGLEATVILELYIDAQGKIQRITVLKDPGNGFAPAAVAALEGLTVSPGKIGGQGVATRFRYPVRFTLK